MSIYAIIFLAIMIAIFIGTYLLNKNTPKPEGCDDMEECSACANFGCTMNSHHKEENN